MAVGNQLTVQVNVFIKAQKEEGVNYLAGANYYWFFTGLMAFAAGSYALFYVFDSLLYAIPLGFAWGLLIFNLSISV